MDVPFLKLLAESYKNDNNLNITNDEISTFLISSYKNFKRNFPSLIDEVINKSKFEQQKLIYSFLDIYYLEKDEIEEDIEKIITENIFQKVFGSISKIFSNRSKSFSPEQAFLFNLISKNYDNCNRTCTKGKNIPENVLMSLLYLNPTIRMQQTKRDEILNRFYSKSEIANFKNEINFDSVSNCLRFCYLDYLTSIYAEGILNYEICKEKLSGKYVKIQALSDILRNYPIDTYCEDIFKTLNSLYTEISDILDYIYLNDSIKKRKWMDIIMEKLNAYRKGQSFRIDVRKFNDIIDYPKEFVEV